MANPDELVDLDGLSTFLDGCDSRFASAGHTHTPASIGAAAANHTHTAGDVGAVTLSTDNSVKGATVGSNQYGRFINITYTDDTQSTLNWDDDGVFISKFDGSSWTTPTDERKPLIKVAGKTISMGKAQGSSSSNTSAPTVSGYTFVSWIACTTSGWVGYVYPEHPDSTPTKFWTGYGGGSGNGNVWVQALYVRS